MSITSLPQGMFVSNTIHLLHNRLGLKQFSSAHLELKCRAGDQVIQNTHPNTKHGQVFALSDGTSTFSIHNPREKLGTIPMTDSALSKALYKAQKFGAQ